MSPPGGRPPTFFFLHVMKTGGTSIVHHVQENFAVGETEPDYRELPPGTPVPVQHYASLVRLWELDDRRRARIRLYMGHYPYWVTELVQPDVTFTVLRDPVDRTISMLRQLAREAPGEPPPLEALYEDPTNRRTLLQDYQAKLLGMSREDWQAQADAIRLLNPQRRNAGHLAHLAGVPVDAERLARAKANLASIELVGLQHDLGGLLAELQRRYGWTFRHQYHHRQAGDAPDVPASFRRRIAEDNPADQELWATAVELVEERRRAGR